MLGLSLVSVAQLGLGRLGSDVSTTLDSVRLNCTRLHFNWLI